MNKILGIVVIAMLPVIASAQLKVSVTLLERKASLTSDTIYYNPATKLKWEQFKGVPVANSDATAITTSGFGYNASLSYDHTDAAKLDIVVYCYFSKSKSWVKAGRKTNYILNHEQKHFDITYIGTCTFYNKLLNASFTQSNFSKEIEKLYKECYTTMHQMQNSYDTETKNGQVEEIQTKWNDSIAQKIASL